MTSDAKIGLLLGLVFIFIIAFIINDLPNFNKEAKNNELTAKMVGLQEDVAGLAGREKKINTEVINPEPLQQEAEPVTETAVPVAPVQQVAQAAGETVNVAPVLMQPQVAAKLTEPAAETTLTATAPTPAEVAQQVTAEAPKPIQVVQEVKKPEQKQETAKRVYVVGEGESLASIAKKVYGSSAGSKAASVEGLFKANKEVLKSPDTLKVGQKLTVPQLPGLKPSLQAKSESPKILAGASFEKVESIGQKRPATVTTAAKPKAQRQYVVKEGDNLWRIADSQLGNGNRYSEIIALNKDVLGGKDSLIVGMKLKLPAS